MNPTLAALLTALLIAIALWLFIAVIEVLMGNDIGDAAAISGVAVGVVCGLALFVCGVVWVGHMIWSAVPA